MDQSPGLSRPVWVDLSSSDPAGSRAFYGALFGWHAEESSDPQYGGYAVASLDGKDVAGIGSAQSPDQPTAWMVYLGTPDADALATRVTAAGGTVIAPPFDVGPQGRMAVFQDPVGAFISAWQPGAMSGFAAQGNGAFAWAELSARGLDRDLAFYTQVFGWSTRSSAMPQGGAYVEFLDGEESLAGAMEMNPMVPAEVPSYWMAYFGVADVDAVYARARELGAREMLPPTDFVGGRFAIVSDPQGAAFGLLRLR